jgi:hypothetical protein
LPKSKAFDLRKILFNEIKDGKSLQLSYLGNLKDKILLNSNWHELRKQEKCPSLAPLRRIFYKTQ